MPRVNGVSSTSMCHHQLYRSIIVGTLQLLICGIKRSNLLFKIANCGCAFQCHTLVMLDDDSWYSDLFMKNYWGLVISLHCTLHFINCKINVPLLDKQLIVVLFVSSGNLLITFTLLEEQFFGVLFTSSGCLLLHFIGCSIAFPLLEEQLLCVSFMSSGCLLNFSALIALSWMILLCDSERTASVSHATTWSLFLSPHKLHSHLSQTADGPGNAPSVVPVQTLQAPCIVSAAISLCVFL